MLGPWRYRVAIPGRPAGSGPRCRGLPRSGEIRPSWVWEDQWGVAAPPGHSSSASRSAQRPRPGSFPSGRCPRPDRTWLALEALTTTQDAEEWYAAALDQIKEAQAREALISAFNRSYHDAVTRSLPKYLEEAAADITPATVKVIKRLTDAAKKLPAGDRRTRP